MQWWNLIRYKMAWWKWAMDSPHLTNETLSRSLGKTREERNANLRLLRERKAAREPKPEQFGLPPKIPH